MAALLYRFEKSNGPCLVHLAKQYRHPLQSVRILLKHSNRENIQEAIQIIRDVEKNLKLKLIGMNNFDEDMANLYLLSRYIPLIQNRWKVITDTDDEDEASLKCAELRPMLVKILPIWNQFYYAKPHPVYFQFLQNPSDDASKTQRTRLIM